jgi:hypothetical protein
MPELHTLFLAICMFAGAALYIYIGGHAGASAYAKPSRRADAARMARKPPHRIIAAERGDRLAYEMMAKNHTSGRTLSQGADQMMEPRLN